MFSYWEVVTEYYSYKAIDKRYHDGILFDMWLIKIKVRYKRAAKHSMPSLKYFILLVYMEDWSLGYQIPGVSNPWDFQSIPLPPT